MARAKLSDEGKGPGQPGDVVYIEGNMPLVLVVPCGSVDAQGGKGRRECMVGRLGGGQRGHQAGEGKQSLGQVGSVGLARAVHAAIGSMSGGHTPHVVVNQLPSRWCDNFSASDGVDGLGDVPEGTRAGRCRAAWDNYHTFIEVAKGRMQQLQSTLLKNAAAGAVPANAAPALVLELEWVDVAETDASTAVPSAVADWYRPWPAT